jgi:hypothetical protein
MHRESPRAHRAVWIALLARDLQAFDEVAKQRATRARRPARRALSSGGVDQPRKLVVDGAGELRSRFDAALEELRAPLFGELKRLVLRMSGGLDLREPLRDRTDVVAPQITRECALGTPPRAR